MLASLKYRGKLIMDEYKISKPMRFFFLVSGLVIWLGIGLTGFHMASWILYIPAVFFTFAVVTGICPGMIFSNMLFGIKS